MLSLGIARAKLRGRRGPASGEAGSCQALPTAGQGSPLRPGSRDTAPKGCGCQLDRQLVDMDPLLRAEELLPHHHHLPHTLSPHLPGDSHLHKDFHRAMAPLHHLVLVMVLHLLHLTSLPLLESPLHLPLQGQHHSLFLHHHHHLRQLRT